MLRAAHVKDNHRATAQAGVRVQTRRQDPEGSVGCRQPSDMPSQRARVMNCDASVLMMTLYIGHLIFCSFLDCMNL